MLLKLNGNEYDIATTLGVSYDLETKYKKKVADILSDADKFDIKQIAELLYIGAKRRMKDLEFNDFFCDLLESEMGIANLQKELSVFVMLLASTDKTEEEIREEMEHYYEKNIDEIKGEMKKSKN